MHALGKLPFSTKWKRFGISMIYRAQFNQKCVSGLKSYKRVEKTNNQSLLYFMGRMSFSRKA